MINRILKTEMVGEDVKLLQINLTELGIYTKGISGHFDTYTKNCVIKYQIENGLEPSGIITVPVWYSIISKIQSKIEIVKEDKEEIKEESIEEKDSEEIEPKKSRKKHE